jgi:TM2 domain-containing membrane protein YozV
MVLMGKILKIENDVVTVGNDDGSLTEVRREDCNFNPNVGDDVNLFTSETKTVCIKAEVKKEEKSDMADLIKNGGININLTQNQGSNNTVPAGEVYYNVGSKHAVSKTPYILWAFLLGALGAHKFYAGKAGQGILYLLFCWTYIPGIIAFIEAICACCQKEDSNGRILV